MHMTNGKTTMNRIQTFTVLLLGIVFGIRAAAAQQTLPEPERTVTLTAYQCRFDRDTYGSQIRATLQGVDGLPIPRDAYEVTVTNQDTSAVIPSPLVEVVQVPERPPLQMILLLDTTDTLQIAPVVNAIADELFPQLQVEDRVSLITFAEEPSPRTQFYTDKIRLLNEHMIDLRPEDGDNRIYDAIYEAVTDFPIGDDTRQVVLVITDSGRRFDDQRTIDEIAERAGRETVQVYLVGINSRADQPDIPDFSAIANRTGGYLWLWESVVITRETIQEGVSVILDDVIETLNSEVLIAVDLEGQEPDAAGFIRFRVDIVTQDEDTATTEIACPVEELFHSITFREGVEDGTVRGPVDIAVDVQTELNADTVKPVFLVNGDVVQDDGNPVLTFNEPPVQPGLYTIGAQLVDESGSVLATTERAINLYVQGDVELSVENVEQGGFFGTLANEARFEVRTDPEFELPPVRFVLAEAVNPDDTRQIGEPEPFVNGVAVKVIDNIRATVESLFPETTEERFIITAIVPSLNSDDPNQATSAPFEVLVPIPPPPEPPSPALIPIGLLNFRFTPWGLALAFLLLNILLYRAVGRSRVRRLINRPDDIELPAQLMSITMRREGIKQQHTLTKKTVMVGRGGTNDINLGDDPNISRQHGVIMWRNGNWYYSNRKRRASAVINGKRRTGFIWHKLVPITEIEIGGTLMIFHSSAQKDISELVKTNL